MADAGLLISGRYRLAEAIGHGGMGMVWRARDEFLGRDVAVKEIIFPQRITRLEQQLACERGMREARSAARLSHPGVITVHDVIEYDGRPWIVMELSCGRSLADLISCGPLPPARVAQFGLQILDALSTAHAAGVIHRDVKPSNVLVDGSRVVLTDFGAAAIQDDPTITRTGVFIGTPAFLAPERALGARGGPACDLWSLGATLYAAVEGHAPYRGEGSVQVLSALLTRDPDPPCRAGSLMPVLTGLLRRDPATRLCAVQALRLLTEAAAPLVVTRPASPRQLDAAPATIPREAREAREARAADNALSGTGRVADDLYLIAHDDRTGKPLLKPRPMGLGLAGALLAELMLAGLIGLRQDKPITIAADPPYAALARDAVLRRIADESEPHPVRGWLLFLAQDAAEDVGARLELAGFLTTSRSRVPGRPGRRIPVDPDRAFAPMLRIRAALDPARQAGADAIVLSGLALACGLGFRLDQYQAGQPVTTAVARLDGDLRDLITQTQAAVDSAVLSNRP